MSVITQNGDSALMMAAEEGRTEVVSLLLEAGADIHLQDKVYRLCQYIQVNKKFFELKNVEYRDGIKSKETRQG